MNDETQTDSESMQVFMERQRTLKMIHVAMLSGVAVFAVVAGALGSAQTDTGREPDRLLLFIAAGLIISGTVVSSLLNQIMGRGISSAGSLNASLAAYQRLVIIRLAVLEGGALMMCVAVLVSGQVTGLLMVAAALFIMYRHGPKQHEFVRLAQQNSSLAE